MLGYVFGDGFGVGMIVNGMLNSIKNEIDTSGKDTVIAACETELSARAQAPDTTVSDGEQ